MFIKCLENHTKINEDATISKINKLKLSLPKGTIENILKNERENIKKILEDEETLKDLSPKIMNILYNYLEEKAVGYTRR